MRPLLASPACLDAVVVYDSLTDTIKDVVAYGATGPDGRAAVPERDYPWQVPARRTVCAWEMSGLHPGSSVWREGGREGGRGPTTRRGTGGQGRGGCASP